MGIPPVLPTINFLLVLSTTRWAPDGMGYMVPTLSGRGFQPVEPRRILRSMAVPSRDALAPSGKEPKEIAENGVWVFGMLKGGDLVW